MTEEHITTKCFNSVKELQGWYCSCRFNYHEVKNETSNTYTTIKEELTEGKVII